MNTINKKSILFVRAVLIFTILVSIWGFMSVLKVMRSNNISLFHSNWVFIWSVILIFTLFILILFILTWDSKTLIWIHEYIDKIFALRVSKTLSLAIYVLLILIIPGLVLFLNQLPVSASILIKSSARIWFMWILILVAALILKISQKDLSFWFSLVITGISQALISSLLPIISVINNYPFSLGWSDTSNYYRASIFFATRIYGMNVALPIMHATQNFLLAAPFLFGNLPIWVHRAWEAVLSVGFPAALGVVFVHRIKVSARRLFWPMVGWAILFLMQGPIHIHLLACAIIFMWGVKPRKFWLTTLVVVLASTWAGMSRINWYPVPGLFAAVLFFLEIPFDSSKSWLRNLWKPFFWFMLGIITAFVSQFLYVLFSGNATHPGDAFTSLTSDLLWYRLFPNATNSTGILPSAVLVSLPILALIIIFLSRRQGLFHPLRLAGIFAALLVLFLGGLVVSIKIGGGSDLHNLDAYLLLLMVLGGYFYLDRMAYDSDKVAAPVGYPSILVVMVILIPVWLSVRQVSPFMTWDVSQTNHLLESVKSQTESVAQKGGEVLFITQRQLLALKDVDVPLVPDYEQDYLMEMVMSHNRPYLDRFQKDLQTQRFSMIVASAYSSSMQGPDNAFGNENDAWVEEVVIPLNCYYQELPGYKNQDVAFYIPRDQPCK
jgi:hypothetical protein